MGLYIEVAGSNTGKADRLVQDYCALALEGPIHIGEVPQDKFLVCVISNPTFDAAGIVFDGVELKKFTDADDSRPRKWLLIGKQTAIILAGEEYALKILRSAGIFHGLSGKSMRGKG